MPSLLHLRERSGARGLCLGACAYSTMAIRWPAQGEKHHQDGRFHTNPSFMRCFHNSRLVLKTGLRMEEAGSGSTQEGQKGQINKTQLPITGLFDEKVLLLERSFETTTPLGVLMS